MKMRKYIYYPLECFYCDITINNRYEHSYDHVVPLAKGGKDHFENLVDCCRNCNHSKADKTLNEWRIHLESQIKGIETNHPKFQHFHPIIKRLKDLLQMDTYENDPFMQAAIEQAKKGLSEGGIPIGSVLVKDGAIIARGHNKRVQEDNPILHGEMDCLFNAGRVGSYKNTVIYSTLMPCYMCAGTIVQFKIPKVVVGESTTFKGAREFMESHGVEVIDLQLPECVQMMQQFIKDKPQLWNEDIGEL